MLELHTVSLFTPLEVDRGRIRISVISRPTLDDGLTPDERIKEGITHHEWIKYFAPPPKLIGSYKRGEIFWQEYQKKYFDFLREPKIIESVQRFANRCRHVKITLACADFCHRRLLAEEIQRYVPKLKIVHK